MGMVVSPEILPPRTFTVSARLPGFRNQRGPGHQALQRGRRKARGDAPARGEALDDSSGAGGKDPGGTPTGDDPALCENASD